mmetsp:Transcript_77181/g.213367  ORF Transcript_77181/g.213367 Transcript_77181/m.213367 type:complete len:231 (+) Transcript_77181:1579-2271(+)
MVSVLGDPGQEQEDGVQGAALQKGRPAHIQDCRHAPLDCHRGHRGGVLQHLDSDLHAQVSDVQVRIGDEGHYVTSDLHHSLHWHAAAILLHQVHQGVQALLPEGAAVLAQVQGEVAADGSQHAGQCGDVHLRDAHRLQRLDGRGAGHLVLDALHKWRQAVLQGSLELRQVACACHKVAEALQGALFHLLVDVSSQQLRTQHFEHREHFHELTARLLRPWPERVNVGANRA